jgi:dihydrofolate reductase
MARVIVGMTLSIDGFVADQTGSAARLYPDLAALRGTMYMDAAIEETGAVLMGKRTFEMGEPDSYVGNYEFQVPIFVLTHEPPDVPPKQDEHLTFTFVTERLASLRQRQSSLLSCNSGRRSPSSSPTWSGRLHSGSGSIQRFSGES